MRRFLLCPLFLLITFASLAQTDDSMSIIDAILDTVSGKKLQIDALNSYAFKRVKTNKELVEKVSAASLLLCQEISYPKGGADAHYNIGYSCVFGPYPKAINNLTRAYDLYVSLNDTLSQANALLSLALDLNQINRIIDDSFRADKEWSNFKLRFEEVHTDFFQRPNDKYPDLSNAEVRLCALIKLNMNMKEASQVLGISPDRVKTFRYRIRKKMNLPTDVNLTTVINSI